MKKSIKNILVTGGAGYIGSILVKTLLSKKYKVTVLDNLRYGGESIIELLNNPSFYFIKGDIRDNEIVKKAFQGIDAVINLAAIVGDPACSKEPELAIQTNLDATKMMYNEANLLGIERFIFASTCSNYGKMSDPEKFVNEDSPLAPVSLYAKTKVAAEEFLLEQNKKNNCKPTCLRFSTVYGLSSRVRFDLTVNEFTKDLALKRELIIFGEQFWRPYCHVEDLANSVINVLEATIEKVEFDVFNVGDTNENYQKKMIVNEILKQLPDSKIKFVKKDEDPRDYRVDFSKISDRLGFKITKTISDGIEQIIKIINEEFLYNPDDKKYRNT